MALGELMLSNGPAEAEPAEPPPRPLGLLERDNPHAVIRLGPDITVAALWPFETPPHSSDWRIT